MFKKLTFLLLPVLMLSLMSVSPAQDADVLIRNPDAAMPIIDGVVDDVWSLATEQTISITTSGSAPSSASDCQR